MKISQDDFKLIKTFYPEFKCSEGIRSNGYFIDWNEIMPVVEKIESTPVQDPSMDEGSTTNMNFQIHKTIAKIYYPFENYKPKFYCAGSSKIEATYKAVVEFIKWYNSQTPHP